jgi:hypothetical protein
MKEKERHFRVYKEAPSFRPVPRPCERGCVWGMTMGCDISDPLKNNEALSRTPKYPAACSACRLRGTRGEAVAATGAWRDSTSSSNNIEARSCQAAGALAHHGPLKLSVGVTRIAASLIALKSRVYLLKDRVLVGLSVGRPVGFSKWAVLIGRIRFDTRPSTPDPTLT